MNRIAPLLAAAGFLVAGGCGGASREAPAASAAPTSTAPAGPKARLELVADRSHATPGGRLLVGARFRIEPGWHLYWRNPGEGGLATDVRIDAPPGFGVGPLLYPGPRRFDSPGNIVSYGYVEEAVLAREIEVPAEAAGPEATFRAEASWLACRDICIREKGEASLTLPIGPAAAGEAPGWVAKLPRPWTELSGASAWWTAGEPHVLNIRVRNSVRLEFFPDSFEDLEFAGASPASDKGGNSLQARFRAIGAPGTPKPHPGLLRVESSGRTTFYEVSATPPGAAEPGTNPSEDTP